MLIYVTRVTTSFWHFNEIISVLINSSTFGCVPHTQWRWLYGEGRYSEAAAASGRALRSTLRRISHKLFTSYWPRRFCHCVTCQLSLREVHSAPAYSPSNNYFLQLLFLYMYFTSRVCSSFSLGQHELFRFARVCKRDTVTDELCYIRALTLNILCYIQWRLHPAFIHMYDNVRTCALSLATLIWLTSSKRSAPCKLFGGLSNRILRAFKRKLPLLTAF